MLEGWNYSTGLSLIDSDKNASLLKQPDFYLQLNRCQAFFGALYVVNKHGGHIHSGSKRSVPCLFISQFAAG